MDKGDNNTINAPVYEMKDRDDDIKETERCEETKTPLVSICCITYNHEKYLSQALDSFLRQECNFSYEILIHDDASTDGTRQIIEGYVERYGDIIRPLYQSENQYSKGIHNISGVYNFPRARGRYIAMCEGDDLWLDVRKLRWQFEFMEAHPECSMCCHAAKLVRMDDAFSELRDLRPYKNDCILSTEQVVSKAKNIPTSSLFFRTELARKLPDWYYDCPVGDIPLQLFMALNGKVFYYNRPLSAYRVGNSGSWSAVMEDRSFEKFYERWERHFRDMKRLYEAFDRDSGGAYHEAVEEAIERLRFQCDINEGELSVTEREENAVFVKELPPVQRALIRLKLKLPFVYGLLRRLWLFIRPEK